MQGKTMLYVHGFGSSAASGTVQLLRQTFPNSTVLAYDLPIHPAEALDLLRNSCATTAPDLIIGTSMGGMYAEMLYGTDRILINPAFQMGETMHSHNMMGKQQWHSPRADGETEFIVTKALVKEYKEITEQCFSGITPDEQQHVFGLFGTRDDTVHTFDLFSAHYRQAIHFDGAHRLDNSSFFRSVVPLIRRISDRQQGIQRPTVLIDYSTLHDNYGKPKSSLYKAYSLLIEHYDVYFVAPAPTENPAQYTEMQQWINTYIGAPAWQRSIFTERKSLLIGDYLIDTAPDPDFMGTGIAFGTPEMKTWEEIIVFFDRLGGQ